MKKIDKLYKWIQTHRSMAPGKLEFIIFIVSLFIGAITYDLHTVFNLDFFAVRAVCGFFLLSTVCYVGIWFIESIVIIIYCKVNYHKTPGEFYDAIDLVRKDCEKYENK